MTTHAGPRRHDTTQPSTHDHDTVKADPRTLEPGEWRGEYLDVGGRRGFMTLHLEVSGSTVRGRYEMRVSNEDKPAFMKGELEGTVEGGRVKLRLSHGERKSSATYEARIADARGFARQAMMGQAIDVGDSGFGGGVWVAWRFADAHAQR